MKTTRVLPNVNMKISIEQIRPIVNSHSKAHYLKKPGVLEWLLGEPSFIKGLNPVTEKQWGISTSNVVSNQWTTKLGESILCEMLHLLHTRPRRISKPRVGHNNKRLLPDFTTTHALYENKARTYTTTGTAGEKILGTPIKYIECKRLYKKPLFIVCMAYQEVEADRDFHLFDPQSPELIDILNMYKTKYGIQFIRASDLLQQIVQQYHTN